MVIVTLASLPGRLPMIEPCIRSLTRQSAPIDRIHLWLCPYYHRLDARLDERDLPRFLRRYPEVSVRFVPDEGPATKLLPLLRTPLQDDAVVVVVDDDHVYPPHFVADLSAAARASDAVVGYCGRTLDGTLAYAASQVVESPEQPVEVDLLAAAGGIAFAKGLIDADLVDAFAGVARAFPDLVEVDDIWINAYLERKGVRRVAIPRRAACPMILQRSPLLRPLRKLLAGTRSRHFADALWLENRTNGKNDRALQADAALWVRRKEAR